MGNPGKCVACGIKFQTKKKGYKRFSLKSQLGQNFDVDVTAALSKAVPEFSDKFNFPDDGHVCDSCFRLLRTTLRQREQLLKTEIEWDLRLRSGPQGKYINNTRTTIKSKRKTHKHDDRTRRSGKRKLEEVQNTMIMNNRSNSNKSGELCSERRRKLMKLEPTVSVLCKNGGHKNFMKKAIAYLIQYRYHKAFSLIINGSEKAKKAFQGVMEKKIRKEAYYFCKTAEKCSQETDSISDIKNFSWKKELKTMALEMPTFYSACLASMETRKGTTAMLPNSSRSTKRRIRPRLGLMMTLPLYTRRERKFGFVMNILALLFHRYGSHETMLKILIHLGVCHRTSQPLIHKVDRMKADDCEQVLSWAVKNLAEIKGNDRVRQKSPRKGKGPKAQLPPTDSNSSDDLDSEVESDDDDENVLHDDEDASEFDEDDDSSLMELLSSDGSESGDEEVDKDDDDGSEEGDDDERMKEKDVEEEELKEQMVEVEGWVHMEDACEMQIVHM
ncbi:uncharacterized protein LOC129269000 [Lytechinus pictus]|uniref:uncharacterized protein LOC129269000 n=1 Tax=Lytechinus pictus TaxID=7653 RepID=UPI0030B9F54C